jgi:trigger factor
MLFSLAGCGAKKETADFSYSNGIDDNGYWENIKALDYVDLCSYNGISVPKNIHEITDEAVKEKVDSILSENPDREKITDRAVADKDTVNIDYVGSIDGVEFEGGSTQGRGTDVTIGVTQYIDDFLDQIVGHKPGETFDVNVTFPKDYGKEELNGKDAVFKCTVNYIVKETEVTEPTDEYVEKVLAPIYSWKTVAEMKDGIRYDLQKTAISDYVQQYITDNTTVKSVPKSLLKYQQDSMVNYYKTYADQMNMKMDDFLTQYVGVSNTKELLKKSEEDNKQNAEYCLIVQAIAEDAGIKVTDEDVAAYFKDVVGTDDYSAYKESYGMGYLKLNTLQQNVLDYVVEKAALE